MVATWPTRGRWRRLSQMPFQSPSGPVDVWQTPKERHADSTPVWAGASSPSVLQGTWEYRRAATAIAPVEQHFPTLLTVLAYIDFVTRGGRRRELLAVIGAMVPPFDRYTAVCLLTNRGLFWLRRPAPILCTH